MKKKARPVVECLRKVRLLSLSKHETTCKTISTFILLSLFLISCKSTGTVKKVYEKISSLRPVYITNTKKVNLLLPAAADGIFEGLQLLNGSFGGTSFNLLSYTQIDATGISLSLMNDFGSDMGNVFYDGNNVVFDSAYFPKALPGEYIICDIQNAFYDFVVLEDNYVRAGLRFEVGDGFRKVYDGKKLIEEICIIDDTVTIKNHLRGYEYKLNKIEE